MKIVIVSLHYGEEGSGGARRAFLWAKGLRRAGHTVHVVSPYVQEDSQTDIYIAHPTRGDEMYNIPAQEPDFTELKIKQRLREWVLWPDPEIRWHKLVTQTVKRRVDSADWLITSSPPESAHAIGKKLAKALGAHWCAELRDSWTHWLKTAIAVTSVNRAITAEAKTLAPQALAKCIPHFSEPFLGVPAELPTETFNLVHAGGFTRSDRQRSLSVLLKELHPIMKSRPNLQLHLMGPLSFEEADLLNNTDINVTYHGWVSLSKSRALQAAADALLLYTPFHGTEALPGKYAEYSNMRKPIIYIGADNVKKMARRHNEFYTLQDLKTLSKGIITPEEQIETVGIATQALLCLFEDAETHARK